MPTCARSLGSHSRAPGLPSSDSVSPAAPCPTPSTSLCRLSSIASPSIPTTALRSATNGCPAATSSTASPSTRRTTAAPTCTSRRTRGAPATSPSSSSARPPSRRGLWTVSLLMTVVERTRTHTDGTARPLAATKHMVSSGTACRATASAGERRSGTPNAMAQRVIADGRTAACRGEPCVRPLGAIGRVMLQHDRCIHMPHSDVQEPVPPYNMREVHASSAPPGVRCPSESSWQSAGPWGQVAPVTCVHARDGPVCWDSPN